MENFDIKKFFSYLKKYIVVFVVVLILSVGGTVLYGYHAKKPIYEAKATMVITRAGNGDSEKVSAVTLNDINLNQKLVPEYSVVAKSDAVLGQVIEKLGLPDSAGELAQNITIKSVLNTAAIDVFVEYGDAKMSAAIANGLVEAFSSEIKKLYGSDNIVQLSAAAEPSEPKNNTATRDILVAVVTSVTAVLSVAFVRFYLDDNIKNDDSTEQSTGLPTIGKIPRKATDSHADETRNNLQFAGVDNSLKTILVTSINPSKGKSSVSVGLAQSFARAGKRVLLIDCDLRDGNMGETLGITSENGLTDILLGDLKTYKKYVHKTSTNKLSFIACGAYSPNPNELFSSKKGKNLIQALARDFDIVILDSAPVDEFAGAVALSSLVDGTLITVRSGNVSEKDFTKAKDMLAKAGARMLGVVFEGGR